MSIDQTELSSLVAQTVEALAKQQAKPDATVARLPRGTTAAGGLGIVAVILLSSLQSLQVSGVDNTLDKLVVDMRAMQEKQAAADTQRDQIRQELGANDERFNALQATVNGIEAVGAKNQARFDTGADEAERQRADASRLMKSMQAALERCEFTVRDKRPIE